MGAKRRRGRSKQSRRQVAALNRWATPAAVGLFALVVLLRAWQGDDAYITWRTAANFVRGDGLTWNQGERVQAFTSPLWLIVGIVCEALFGEVYFSVLLISVLFSSAALWALLRESSLTWEGRVALCLTAVGSATLVDFGTSGLETPALALLTVLFALAVASDFRNRAFVLSSLLFLCRPDSVVLTVPSLLLLVYESKDWRGAVRQGLLRLSPIALWVAFATFYFGSPVANTALAKLNSEVPKIEMIQRGAAYLLDYLMHEPWPSALILCALVLGFRTNQSKFRGLSAGLLLHLLYVVWVGGDFMRGRFVFAAIWQALSLLVLLSKNSPPRVRLTALCLSAAALALPNVPLFRLGVSDVGELDENNGIVSERAYFARTSALLSVLVRSDLERRQSAVLPPNPKAETCRKISDQDLPVISLIEAGYCGYFGGPRLIAYDWPGLTNPFLARTPFVPSDGWRIGHLTRGNLGAYVARRHLNRAFGNEEIEAAYRDVTLVTQGDLFSSERLKALVRLLSGAHQSAFEQFKAPAPPPSK